MREVSGNVPAADRIQRLSIGALLMALTLSGLAERADWRTLLALALQLELLVTGIAGWCPVYWGCSLARSSLARSSLARSATSSQTRHDVPNDAEE